MKIKEITLTELLAAREERAKRQKELIKKYGCPLLSLTVMAAGTVKRSDITLKIAKEGVGQTQKAFCGSILFEEQRDLDSGFEYFAALDMLPEEAKKISCQIENSHPLGRLFDIDILDLKGVPLSRESVGEEKRKCLLCGSDAALCAREKTHPHSLLNGAIEQKVEDFFKKNV